MNFPITILYLPHTLQFLPLPQALTLIDPICSSDKIYLKVDNIINKNPFRHYNRSYSSLYGRLLEI